MPTAYIGATITFASFAESPKTLTSPSTSLFEFVVRTKDPLLVTCKVEGPSGIGLLAHLSPGVGVFVAGALEESMDLDSECGDNTWSPIIVRVDQLVLTGRPCLKHPAY